MKGQRLQRVLGTFRGDGNIFSLKGTLVTWWRRHGAAVPRGLLWDSDLWSAFP